MLEFNVDGIVRGKQGQRVLMERFITIRARFFSCFQNMLVCVILMKQEVLTILEAHCCF